MFLFLLVVGLAQPQAIVTGVAAGLLLRRWWLSLIVATIATGALSWGALPGWHGSSFGGSLMFVLAFTLAGAVWAGVVQAGRAVIRPRGGRL